MPAASPDVEGGGRSERATPGHNTGSSLLAHTSAQPTQQRPDDADHNADALIAPTPNSASAT